ncbi:MAG: LPXTG cell wall anchor domain-containing protein [Acidimicrobiia bacterium]|nr:LPXTG cell wall anchor domain-containing protein [Acidimicrobiia bacterium]
MTPFCLLAQAEDSGFRLPEGPTEWLLWVGFAAVITGLWWVVRRTRRRAQDEYFARKRQEQEERRRRLGED